MAWVGKELMNQSPDTDQLNVGTRERGESRTGPKFLPRVFEAALLATYSTASSTTRVQIHGDREGYSYCLRQADKV